MTFRNSLDRLDSLGPPLKDKFSFGVSFLDKALGGIRKDDLIIISSRTGGGKTELVTQTALTNALEGKHVYFFALEAFPSEIEWRIKYKNCAQNFYQDPNWRRHDYIPSFQDFRYGECPDFFELLYERKEAFQNLFTFYRGKDFSIETFEAQMTMIGEKADLVLIDHLHYFDWAENLDDNRAVKSIIKTIRDLQTFYQVPIILVAHLRKRNRGNSGLLPDIEDLYGTSELSKMATKIIVSASAPIEEGKNDGLFPTYFRILKNRVDGSRCFPIGICGFDISQGKYSNFFDLGELDFANSEVKRMEYFKWPAWATKN